MMTSLEPGGWSWFWGARVHDAQHFEALLARHGVHDGAIKRRVRGQDALPW
jgi:hypothetical protein